MFFAVQIKATGGFLQGVMEMLSDLTFKEIILGIVLPIIIALLGWLVGKTKFIKRICGNYKTRKEISKAIDLQVINQLEKQKNSSKYILNTFIEIDRIKDKLRYFTNPILFVKKFIDELGILDFRFLNVFLETKRYERFKFDFRLEALRLRWIRVRGFAKGIERMKKYLEIKKEELEKYEGVRSNNFYLKINLFHDKINKKLKEVEILKSRVLIINENAGQGKTNIVCDLHHEFFKKLKIPAVFFVGNDLKSDDIMRSFIEQIFGRRDRFNMDELMNYMCKICKKEKKFFVITIDGLNENLDYRNFPGALEKFIEYLLKYDFIRVILTCRTEYFNANYSNIINSSFKSEITIIKQINKELNDNSKNKLFEAYLKHFEVDLLHYSEEVFDVLTSDFLMLRIFAEAYSGQKVLDLRDIFKYEVFKRYYERKCKLMNERLAKNDELNVIGGSDIRNFFKGLVEYMFKEHRYHQLPLDTFINDVNREVLVRCIDEEVLLRRDLQGSDKIILGDEVLNFTFDEFRDYLISRYLVEELFSKDRAKFELFVENELVATSHILEGVSKYLFYESRRHGNVEIKNFIKRCNWYQNIFLDCLFSMDDSFIDNEDLTLLETKFLGNIQNSSKIIRRLMRRYDIDYYQKLNLDWLMNVMMKLNDADFNRLVNPMFDVDDWNEHYRHDHYIWPIKRLIENLESIMSVDELSINTKLHSVFEFMIFLVPTSMSVSFLLQDYAKKYPNEMKCYLERRLSVKSNELKKWINESLNYLNNVL